MRWTTPPTLVIAFGLEVNFMENQTVVCGDNTLEYKIEGYGIQNIILSVSAYSIFCNNLYEFSLCVACLSKDR